MTRTSWLCFAVTLCLSQSGNTASKCPEELGSYSYSYFDTSDEADPEVFGHSFRIELNRKRVIYGGHVGDGFRNTQCKQSDPQFCFHTRRFSFAVPKSGIVVGQTWKSFGRSYKVIALRPFSLMGLRTTVFEIVGDSTFQDTDRTYYYSAERGLLAIKRRSKINAGYIFQISDSSVGYPVQHCKSDLD